MQRQISTLVALAALALGFVVIAGVSHAQYPPPTGGVSVLAGDTSVEPGGTTPVTCEVVGPDGTPVPNTGCTITIVSQPGTTATVGSTTVTKLTNAQGIATAQLYVGETPGLIVVEAESGGFVSTVLVTVEGESPSPPQAPVTGIQPPSTGSGGLLGN